MATLEHFMEDFSGYLATGECARLAPYLASGAESEFLRVYRNGFYRACTQALAANFPAVVSVVGEEYFNSLAKRYINQHPPVEGTLAGYGRSFPDYLAAHRTVHRLPYLADIARLDYSWLAAYFAAAQPPLDSTELNAMLSAGTDITKLRLDLAAGAVAVSLDYGVVDIWRALKEQGRLAQSCEVAATMQYALLWRLESTVQLRILDPGEFALLRGIEAGLALGAAAEQAQQADERLELAEIFAQMIDNGLLALTHQQTSTRGDFLHE